MIMRVLSRQPNPAFIVLPGTVCCHQSAAAAAKRPGRAGLTAGRDGHIILLNHGIASGWGPRVIDLLRTVAAAPARDRGQ
jgi:iron complex transport system substrate-binding protein